MLVRNLITDSDLGLLQDILRGYFNQSDLANEAYFRILDMDIDAPALNPEFIRDEAVWISDGHVQPGFITAMYKFLMQYRSQFNNRRAPDPVCLHMPFDAGTDTHDFWLWLIMCRRCKDEAYLRWPKDVVDRLWRYFKSDRFRDCGYAVTCMMKDGEEVMEVSRCHKEPTSSDNG